MARIASRFFCLACAWVTQVALGRDGDGQEYFPLSGGVSNGVEVTVKAGGIKPAAGAAKLEFLTPSRETVFRWDMNTQREISRSSGFHTEDQRWGGWPLDGVDVDFSLQFYKTSKAWRVSVNAIRTPWFDFNHPDDDNHVMTHLSVYDGFEDVEVVQDRPQCKISCHPDECSSCEGATCFTQKPSGECLITSRTMDDTFCCDGLPPNIGLSGSGLNREWVSLFDDQGLVDRACRAFNDEAACAGAQWKEVGRKGQVVNFEGGVTYKVWLPSMQDADLEENTLKDLTFPAEYLFSFPAFILSRSRNARTKSALLPQDSYPQLFSKEFKDKRFRIDRHTGLVWRSSSSLLDGTNVQRGWFVNLLQYNTSLGYGRRWFEYGQYHKKTLEYACGRTECPGDIYLWLTDQPVSVSSCQDTPAELFTDIKENPCATYTEKKWCTRHGEPDPDGDWCDVVATNKCVGNNPFMFDIGGECPDDAAECRGYVETECCQCGGGDHEDPGWTAPSGSSASDMLLE